MNTSSPLNEWCPPATKGQCASHNFTTFERGGHGNGCHAQGRTKAQSRPDGHELSLDSARKHAARSAATAGNRPVRSAFCAERRDRRCTTHATGTRNAAAATGSRGAGAHTAGFGKGKAGRATLSESSSASSYRKTSLSASASAKGNTISGKFRGRSGFTISRLLLVALRQKTSQMRRIITAHLKQQRFAARPDNGYGDGFAHMGDIDCLLKRQNSTDAALVLSDPAKLEITIGSCHVRPTWLTEETCGMATRCCCGGQGARTGKTHRCAGSPVSLRSTISDLPELRRWSLAKAQLQAQCTHGGHGRFGYHVGLHALQLHRNKGRDLSGFPSSLLTCGRGLRADEFGPDAPPVFWAQVLASHYSVGSPLNLDAPLYGNRPTSSGPLADGWLTNTEKRSQMRLASDCFNGSLDCIHAGSIGIADALCKCIAYDRRCLLK